MEKCNLKKLNDVEIKEQYQVKVSNKLAALGNLGGDDEDINSAWKVLSLGYNELKQHKPWFDEGYSVCQRK
jgi:hypothetical protein